MARIAHIQAGQPQRTLIISRTRGYHGVTYGGTSAQGIAPNREGFGPFVGDVVQVPADDLEAIATLLKAAWRRDRRCVDRAGPGSRRRVSLPRPATSKVCAACATNTARS